MTSALMSLPLVTYSQTSGFMLHQQAIDAIQRLSHQKQLSVLSMVGKTKTGKSFLLNKLINQFKPTQKNEIQSFQVCNSVDGGTKGLRILPIEFQKHLVIVLEMEGLGNLTNNSYSESKLFAIALLISSILLYNTNGPLDQQGLQGLSILVEIGKLLESTLVTNTKKKLQMPQFYMILRDFALVLEDKNREEITAKQYFEEALEQQKGSSNVVFNKNRIRRVLKEIFTMRDCITLPFPSEDVWIQNDSDLREEFEQQIQVFSQVILKKLEKKPKKINGKTLNAQQWLTFTSQLISSINNQTKEGSLKLEGLVLQVYRQQQKSIRQKFYTIAQTLFKKASVRIQQTLSTLQLCSQVDIDHFMLCVERNKEEIVKIKSQLQEKYMQSCISIQELIQKQVGEEKKMEQLNFNHSAITRIKDFKEIYEFKQEMDRKIQSKQQEIELKLTQIAKTQNQEKLKQQEKVKFENILQQVNLFQNEKQLDKLYLTFINDLKSTNSVFDAKTLESYMLRLQVAYLRRKLQLKSRQQLTKQCAITKSEPRVLKEKNLNDNVLQMSQKMISKDLQNRNNQISTFCSKQMNVSKGQQQNKKSFLIPYLNIKPQQINIEILRTLVKQDNRGNNFIEYALQVVLLDKRWTFNRRWKDFNQLHNILHHLFASNIVPSFTPGQVIMSEFTFSRKEQIQTRRSRLQSYLRELLEVENVRNSRIFQKFLKINKEYVPFI